MIAIAPLEIFDTYLLRLGMSLGSPRVRRTGFSFPQEIQKRLWAEGASALPWDQWLQAFGNLLETLNRARTAPDFRFARMVRPQS
jgi:hypothetical protein